MKMGETRIAVFVEQVRDVVVCEHFTMSCRQRTYGLVWLVRLDQDSGQVVSIHHAIRLQRNRGTQHGQRLLFATTPCKTETKIIKDDRVLPKSA